MRSVLEPCQAALQRGPGGLWRRLAARTVAAAVATLGGEYDVLAPRPKRAPEKALAFAVAVELGGIEVRDARVQRGVDDFLDVASSMCHPKLLQPRPTVETVSEPIVRVSIVRAACVPPRTAWACDGFASGARG